MKVAPVSADLLIKLAIGAAVLGGAYWLVRKGVNGINGAIASIGNLPGNVVNGVRDYASEVADAAITSAREGGATWQAGYVPNPDYDNYSNEGRYSVPYVQKYSNPLVNDQGYDFGLLSG